jgi:hypothetical protein
MKTNFDWQTEENSALEHKELAENSPRSRRKLGCLTVTLIVSAVVFSSFAWLLSRRQSEAIASVREDVLLAFELQQQAARNDDKELFSALLSSSDPTWKHDQERLLASSLFDDRSSIGLVGDPVSFTQKAIDLSPDLQKAEVTYAQTYKAAGSSMEILDIELLHTLVYRLEDGRWLNAPLDPSFWGAWNEIDGQLSSITYPERDVELARELAKKIDAHLKGLCSDLEEQNEHGLAYCAGNAPWRIRLSTDVESLLGLVETPAVRSSEFDYELPAPSIIGIPQNETDFESYLEIYSRPLLNNVEAALLSTAPYPNQNIYALCFDHPLSGRRLYRYDRRQRSWRPILAVQTFNHLSALPDDSAIMLADDDTLTVVSANSAADSTAHAAVWQGNLPSADPRSLIGWIETADAPYHLVHHSASDSSSPGYSALELGKCDATSCEITKLPGFPVPSRTSGASLYMSGSDIIVVSGPGEVARPVGRGFSPFWVDDSTFGFVRFAGDMDSGITTQVVLGDLDESKLQVLFDGGDLARAAAIPWENGLFVNEIIPNSVDPDLLLVSSTGIGDYSGRYYIFSADISNRLNQPMLPELELEIARSGTQGGVPGLFTPTGSPPFLVSPDGRWLAMTELKGQGSETWTVLVHDLQTGISSEVSDSVPAMPGNFPLLDWSNNGQWLLIADRNYLHLIAPEYEYQELVAHDFDACSHIVWAD